MEHRFLAMGTEISIKLICTARDRNTARAAIDQAVHLLHDFGHDGWAWGSGVVAEINQALAAGEIAKIPITLRPLFKRAWQIRQETDGLYEPRIAQLVRLWGFDDVARLRESPPERNEIDTLLSALKAAPAYDGGDRYGPAPGAGWDFGGIGKGFIIDQVLELLRARGFSDAVVDAGGNLAVRGGHVARPWRVGIRDPRPATAIPRLLVSLDVSDEAVITHGDDQRFFEHAGRRYAHILCPFTGAPVQGLRSITVVHPDATRADAAGAAVFVAGKEGWRKLAKKLALAQVIAIYDEGMVHAPPALARRLQLKGGDKIMS